MSFCCDENKNIIAKLFDADLWHILVRIFRHLDGTSLESCNLVCSKWTRLIQDHVITSVAQKRLANSFRSGVASTRRIQLSGKFYAMKCDSTCIVVGLENGQIEVWSRISSNRNSLEVGSVAPEPTHPFTSRYNSDSSNLPRQNACRNNLAVGSVAPEQRQSVTDNFTSESASLPKYDKSFTTNSYRCSRRRLMGLNGHTNLIKSVDVSPSWLVSGSWDGGVRLWKRSSGDCYGHSYPHCNKVAVTGVAINESEGWILSSSRDGTVRKIRLGELTKNSENIDRKLDVDKNWVASHRLPNQSESRVHSQCGAVHGESIIDMSVDGNNLLTGGSDGNVLYWEMNETNKDQESYENETNGDETGEIQPITVLVGHGNGIRCVSLNGEVGISGSRDRTARVWNVISGKLLRVLTHSSDVRTVTFNSNIIITGDDYPDLFVWDTQKCLDQEVEDGASDLLLRTLTGHNGMVHSMQCTPTSLLTCDVTGLIIERDFWSSVEEGPTLRILRCSEGVNCMAVDETSIACGLLNKTVNVYARKTLELSLQLCGHQDHIWCIDMSPRFICTGSWDASVIIWSRENGDKVYTFEHPDHKEISGVKIIGSRVYVSSLSGAIVVLEELDDPEQDELFDLKMFVPSRTELGEIYSMAADERFLLTGHTYASTSLQLWSIADVQSQAIIRENTSESIIWNLQLAYPLALVCRDNEILDVYHLETQSSLKSLKHQSKVLNAALYRGIIVVGCQYGLMVFWNLHHALTSKEELIDINHSSCLKILTEHSGAISNVHIDNDELITDDYDGIVMLRNMRTHSYLKNIFQHCDENS